MDRTVKNSKGIAYALFFVFLCIAPLFAYGQDSARLIDIPDIINDNSGSQDIRDAVSEYGHIVFGETDVENAAREAGLQPGYWDVPAQIPQVNKKAKHDALVKIEHVRGKKHPSLVITIYNASTGEVVAELERSLKKKKVTRDDVKAVAKGINLIVAEIQPVKYPDNIILKIVSTPSGATVERNGAYIGTTPFEYKADQDASLTEQWTVTYPGREPVLQTITFDGSRTFDVNIPITEPQPQTLGKVKGGSGRPIFAIGFNISPSIRKYDFTDNATVGKKLNMTHRSAMFAMFSFDLTFFPFPLFLDNDYLQGLGITTSVGFGFLDTSIRTQDTTGVTSCATSSDGTYKCETTYIRFNMDLIYRLLLQKKEGKLDPNGMSLDFLMGVNLMRYNVQDNPYYLGNDYTGFHLGTAFITPLGMPEFRLKLNLGFYFNGGHDALKKFAKLGTSRKSSWGLDLGAQFMYDIWKGIYAQVGYDFKYINSQYGGTGTVSLSGKDAPANPKNAEIGDFYHEIMLGFGYMLY